MRNSKKKNFREMIIRLVLMLIIAGVGGILAYFAARVSAVENIFTPGIVSCTVNETFDGTEKTNVSIANTGNTDAYIRAFIVANWVNSHGDVYGRASPKTGDDYTIDLGDSWIEGDGGYYYYHDTVSPGSATPVLIERCTEIEGRAPDGYTLSIEIIASAVQADPNKTYETWGVKIG